MKYPYGTKEYWQQEIKHKELQKKIFKFNLAEVLKGGEDMDLEMLVTVSVKFFEDVNDDIETAKKRLADVEGV